MAIVDRVHGRGPRVHSEPDRFGHWSKDEGYDTPSVTTVATVYVQSIYSVLLHCNLGLSLNLNSNLLFEYY
jgi:hypothetical protein